MTNLKESLLAVMLLAAPAPLLSACDNDSGNEVAESAEELINDTGRAIEDATD
jgi:predicted small secreted protein